MNDWAIYIDDCIKGMGGLGPGSADLVFADPPYNQDVSYGSHYNDKRPDGEYLAWCEAWMTACAAILKPHGTMLVMVSDEYADDFGVFLRRKLGLHRRNWIKWYESFGVNCRTKFNRCSRHIFYMTRNKTQFTFNREYINRPSDRQVKYGDKRAVDGGKNWDDVWGINPPIPRVCGTYRERMPDFPTQLPVQLLTAIVGFASNPGDLVVDPFCGSGTTGEACIRLGRCFIGYETSAKFAHAASHRLARVEKEISI
jgi:DNA modification methylase